jgi:hypothetical protein
MIIQWILVIGLLLFLFYALLQRAKSRWVNMAIALTSVTGIYFVMFPEQTNEIAKWMGVGRGADLILYCWLVISLIVSVNLQFKIMGLQEMMTELTRELALRAPREPPAQDLRPASTK